MGKRRTRPYYLSEDEHEREQGREKRMVEGITGAHSVAHSVAIVGDKRRHQPKASFRIRLNEVDNLQLTIWSGKKDPASEVIVAAIQRKQGDTWDKIGRIAVYRSSDGDFSQLPDRER